jgi:DNA-binding CsgD family transcriptional regulator
MYQTSTHDLRSILECLEALQTVCTLQELPSHLLTVLSHLVGSDVSFCSSFADGCNTLEITPAELQTVQLEPDYFQQNPLIQRYSQTRDGNAYKISDFLSEPELYRREGLYGKHLQPLGVADQLAMVISEPFDAESISPFNIIPKRHLSPNQVSNIVDATTLGRLAIGFYRTTRSFNERDRILLNLIRPHIAHAYHNAQLYTKLQQELGQLHQAMDDLGSIILSPGGRIQFISPHALQLLNHYFPDSPRLGEQLPDPIQCWVRQQIEQREQTPLAHPGKPLQIEHCDRRLSIRLLGSAASEQLLLTLEENRYHSFSIESLRLIGLTRREAAVLIWVARGKTNAEIAIELILSQKTVNKHLENLCKKLGVKNRAAAVTKALELLGMMD